MPVGETIKLFACWPNVDHNLRLLDNEPPGPERLLQIVDRLEKGRSAIVSKNTPLYLSSGCLHAVVTLRGGFMYAGNFMTASNGPAFLRSLRLSPAFIERYDNDGRRGLVANVLDQLDVALERSSCWLAMVEELVKSWPAIEGLSQRKSDRTRLAQRVLALSKKPQWQQVNMQCGDLSTTKLDTFINAQLKYAGKGRSNPK